MHWRYGMHFSLLVAVAPLLFGCANTSEFDAQNAWLKRNYGEPMNALVAAPNQTSNTFSSSAITTRKIFSP
jgi:hypothetical protein